MRTKHEIYIPNLVLCTLAREKHVICIRLFNYVSNFQQLNSRKMVLLVVI